MTIHNRIVGSIVAVGLLAAGCAESSANARVNLGESPIDAEFVRNAENELREAGGSLGGWERGVVTKLREKPWNIAVINLDGGVVLDRSWDCDYDDIHHDDLLVLFDVGDMIEWSVAGPDGGTDNRVCTDEIALVRKAVTSIEEGDDNG